MTGVFWQLWWSVCLLTILSSCAGLPPRIELTENNRQLAREAFKAMAAGQHQCNSSVDADVTVTLESRFYSGTMSGYLQAMAPAALKVVGVNPFGQPLVVLISDGHHFSYSLLNESLSYEGETSARAFSRFAPTGFDPTASFYLLIGRLKPGRVEILEISGDREGRGTWVELVHGGDNAHSLVLFDPERQLVLRYLQLSEAGDTVMEISYDEHYPGPCNLPGRIAITSKDRQGNLVIRLSEWQTATPFSPVDFVFEVPAAFKRVKVQ